MSIDRFFTTPVTIIEPGTASDGYNGTASDWDNPASRTRTAGWLTQVSTSEEIGGRTVTVTGWQLFLRADTQISAKARVESSGTTYQVDGQPDLSPQTMGGSHHIEVRLRIAVEVTA